MVDRKMQLVEFRDRNQRSYHWQRLSHPQKDYKIVDITSDFAWLQTGQDPSLE